MFDMIAGYIIAARNNQEKLDAMRKVLSKDDMEAYLERRVNAINNEKEHQKKLEIAREGRSLNFWGDR